ncbi:nucleotidyltransferase family protein [Lysinibacillus sphaericus]
MISTEKDIINLIQSDEKMMEILRAASRLNLPDWWICAGFVRSKIWDELHGFANRTETPDVDVIYFDESSLEEETEKRLEAALRDMLPEVPWSVKNEARMHVVNDLSPYESSEDAISKFPETATALGAKLDSNQHLILTAPWGVDDVLNMEVRPTPYFNETHQRAVIYEERITKKNWKSIWPEIKVHHTGWKR